VFGVLEKYDYLALDIISLWGFTTVDICCFRGVTALAFKTHRKAVGFFHQFQVVITESNAKAFEANDRNDT
jgi:hypothetical protein